jgi:hypothetical protein
MTDQTISWFSLDNPDLSDAARARLENMTDTERSHWELMTRTEDLHDDLAVCVYDSDFLGQVLKHPLVFAVPYHPQQNAYLNQCYDAKQRAIAEAIADSDWSSFLWMHERPYRVEAFFEIQHELDDHAYWDRLGTLWTDSENIYENLDVWVDLLDSDRPGRDHMMDDEERAALAAMPDTITVWRGHSDINADGWSWTTDRDRAVWFANRFTVMENRNPYVTEATVAKTDVIAYMLARKESEIVVNPDNVTVITETALGATR